MSFNKSNWDISTINDGSDLYYIKINNKYLGIDYDIEGHIVYHKNVKLFSNDLSGNCK